MIRIRPESSADIEAIRQINLAAFAEKTEADLVDLLRSRGKLLLSLVAEDQGLIVGHIAFSRVKIESDPGVFGLGLAPMAVMPSKQKQGIGSSMVLEGLESCRRLGTAFVVVLGHAEYYPRFGFKPAKEFGIRSKWDVPDDVFRILELQKGALAQLHGLASYEAEFDEF